jgi:ABC-type amino acid transport system permease subunit
LEDWKIKISVLWLVGELTGVIGLILSSFEPGVMEQIIGGEVEGIQITPELLLVFAVIFLIPLAMAFLSLTLKNSTNRWANIIVGIGYTVFGLVDSSEKITKPYYVLLGIAGTVAAALVVWYAWRSKQKP